MEPHDKVAQRHLSWRQTARSFQTSWEAVYRSVEGLVQWGLARRKLQGVRAIGVDEIRWGQGKRADGFLTVIYPIDIAGDCCGWDASEPERPCAEVWLPWEKGWSGGLRFVCSDMWQPYLNVIAAKAGQALHVLDRFHITMHLNQALDQVRRVESGRLRGRPLAQRLKRMRWQLLRKGTRVRGHARRKLDALVASKLATARAWNLKESFQYLWHYKSYIWAGAFLDYWCALAMRSRLEPMKKVARMLRTHEKLLLNWFKAKGEISGGAVEGLNNKIRVVTDELTASEPSMLWKALYHTLGNSQNQNLPIDFADQGVFPFVRIRSMPKPS